MMKHRNDRAELLKFNRFSFKDYYGLNIMILHFMLKYCIRFTLKITNFEAHSNHFNINKWQIPYQFITINCNLLRENLKVIWLIDQKTRNFIERNIFKFLFMKKLRITNTRITKYLQEYLQKKYKTYKKTLLYIKFKWNLIFYIILFIPHYF